MANQIFSKNRLKTKEEAPELVQHFCRKPDLRFHIAENRSGFIANIGGEEYDINIKLKLRRQPAKGHSATAKFEYRRIKRNTVRSKLDDLLQAADIYHENQDRIRGEKDEETYF